MVPHTMVLLLLLAYLYPSTCDLYLGEHFLRLDTAHNRYFAVGQPTIIAIVTFSNTHGIITRTIWISITMLLFGTVEFATALTILAPSLMIHAMFGSFSDHKSCSLSWTQTPKEFSFDCSSHKPETYPQNLNRWLLQTVFCAFFTTNLWFATIPTANHQFWHIHKRWFCHNLLYIVKWDASSTTHGWFQYIIRDGFSENALNWIHHFQIHNPWLLSQIRHIRGFPQFWNELSDYVQPFCNINIRHFIIQTPILHNVSQTSQSFRRPLLPQWQL